ncbi:MAG: plasmid recombination protein [Oscillospiraceae bacterium]|nr:plasmid recombination protein [Oscillospiraceae bacterium]
MNDKNYSVARVEQHTKASIGKSERHIERKNESYENMNVDLSRTPMNIHYQSCGDLTYNAHLDKLVEEGSISLRGLKKDAKVFDEMIFDVNTAYFEERGGYEYACQFYEEAFHFAQKEYGQENIVSAVMHADELNTALTEQLGHPVCHYHMHVVALPVVDKEVLWTKRCKDPALVGTVKEVIHQISLSKKWASPKITDENGHTDYQILQSVARPFFRAHAGRRIRGL